jgi:hypothetical protein
MSSEHLRDEDFLARWFRRKQEARTGQAAPQPEQPVEAKDPPPAADAAQQPADPEIDLSNLPPIDSIDASTDITAFLRKGIPQELSRAALRRAWSADPAIRDFVGLAENAWDFNDPNAMPGFGPLDYTAEQVEALVRRIVGGVAEAAESRPNPLVGAAELERSDRAEARLTQASSPVEESADARPSAESVPADLQSGSAAPQPTTVVQDESEEASVRRRSRHGGALPQ